MPILSTVLLSIKGDVRRANLTLTSSSDINIEILQKYFKKKEAPEQVCYYEYDNKIIFVFGYKKGKKGTENKVKLPDPHGEQELFGDAIVLVSQSHKWTAPIPFTVDQWVNFVGVVNGISEAKSEAKSEPKSGAIEEAADDEEDTDDEDEDEEEILSEEEKSVKDDFDASEDENSILGSEEEEEQAEEIVAPVKRRKAPVYTKVDTSALKEEIALNSEPESNKLRQMCLSGLSFLKDTFTEENIRALERGIFQTAFEYAQKNYIARNWKSPQFIEIYRQVVRSVFSNIHPESPVHNPRLLKRVLDGEFTLESIPAMSAYEMFPENWFELKDKLLQREQKILEGNKSRATDQFKCRRCQKRECTYYELQTRSADEPMTIFITCLNCGKEWRQGG